MMITKIIRRCSLITILLIMSISTSLCVGSIMIHSTGVIKGIFTQDDFILNEYRIPRTLLGITIGSNLAISGAIIRVVIRNPLVSPDVIGIPKGASLVIVIIIMTFLTTPLFVLLIGSFLGAFAISLFLLFLISKYDVKGSRLALISLAIDVTCTTIVQFLLVRNPLEANKVFVWLIGSLYGHDMSNICTILPRPLITIPITILLSYQLDALNLGDAVATVLGLRAKIIKMLLLILAVTSAGSVISVTGGINFLGLIAPHIARQLIGNEALHVIIMSGLIGAILLISGDGSARGVHPPLDIPVGITIAIVGAPYFLILLRRVK